MSSETIVECVEWGVTALGEPVHLYSLSNDQMQVKLTTYGARLTSVKTPDKAGCFGEVTLGADEIGPYLTDKAYLGATIGRFGNRIAEGQFVLDGNRYHVPLNDGPNALHGGPCGFDQKMWAAEVVANGVKLSYESPDGEMGFPGNLSVSVTYTLKDMTLAIEYGAVADCTTVLNLTNHAYWNLSGQAGTIADHTLRLHGAEFTPVDSTLIPTGEIRSVEGTPLDFQTFRVMGKDWDDPDEQIQLGRGYDHNWVIAPAHRSSGEPVLAAEVLEPISGRRMSVFTTEPGIQFYSGNFLDGSFLGRNDRHFERRSGFCLETQHFPDSPNHANFPSARLEANAPFSSKTVIVFA